MSKFKPNERFKDPTRQNSSPGAPGHSADRVTRESNGSKIGVSRALQSAIDEIDRRYPLAASSGISKRARAAILNIDDPYSQLGGRLEKVADVGENASFFTSPIVATHLKPHQKAFLDTIASTESQGYNVLYRNYGFDDFSRHPDVKVRILKGPKKGLVSTAAGRYQMLGSTWRRQKQKRKLPDFSPENQDIAAWELAKEDYSESELDGKRPSDTLDDVLQSGNFEKIAQAGERLAKTWTSFPRGIEATTNKSRFVSEFRRNLAGHRQLDNLRQNFVFMPASATNAPAKPSDRIRDAHNRLEAIKYRDLGGQRVAVPYGLIPNLPTYTKEQARKDKLKVRKNR